MILDTGNKVTRLEVIDNETGREYVNYGIDDIQLHFQDNGKTLNIFIKSKYSNVEKVNILC